MKHQRQEKENPKNTYTNMCSPVDANWSTMNVDRSKHDSMRDSASEMKARIKRAYNVTEVIE